ncbi:MAG TPA: FAD-dependent monooxygenase [Phycisphaerae bacterium]|nr:FAD-dependent monooxygenase [Phycisphaerae bacterium]
MTHDILIIGAGPAGSAAALLLARRGLRVALCDSKAFPREKVCGEFLGPRARPLLHHLGVLDEFDHLAGPPITRVLACAGHSHVTAPLPPDPLGNHARAISRATLDHLLLEHARHAGAAIFQPCHITAVTGSLRTGFAATARDGQTLRSKTVALAHGLAQRGDLSPTATKPATTAAPYLCFKTHLADCDLPRNTIAIAGAPGIYAGLVHSSNHASLAFVLRKDRLTRLGRSPDAQLAALRSENPAFSRLLNGCRQADPWLSTGPLSPGVRSIYRDGRFFLGNAAGEVHALVGEGITLALRSAILLADAIAQHGLTDAAGDAYARAWPRFFKPRRAAAGLFANLIMRPALARPAAALLRAAPPLLNACVRWAGK